MTTNTATSPEDVVVALVARGGGVTMVEVKNTLAPIMDVDGPYDWCKGHENLVIWARMSDDFIKLMQRLLHEERIYAHPTHVLTYLYEGAMLRYPVAKRPPKNGYKEPHWLPVLFRMAPLPERRR
jgi:hypothetical protein